MSLLSVAPPPAALVIPGISSAYIPKPHRAEPQVSLFPTHRLPLLAPSHHNSHPTEVTRDFLISPLSSYFSRTSQLRLAHRLLPWFLSWDSLSLLPSLPAHLPLLLPYLPLMWLCPQGSAEAPLAGPTLLGWAGAPQGSTAPCSPQFPCVCVSGPKLPICTAHPLPASPA